MSTKMTKVREKGLKKVKAGEQSRPNDIISGKPIEELLQMQSKLRKELKECSDSCLHLMDKRDEKKREYGNIVEESNSIMEFLNSYALHSIEEKVKLTHMRASDESKVDRKIGSIKHVIESTKEGARDVYDQLALQEIKITHELSESNDLLKVKKKLYEALNTAKKYRYDCEKCLFEYVTGREDNLSTNVSNLKAKSKKYIDGYLDVSTQCYKISRGLEFQKILKGNLDLAVIFRELASAVFAIFTKSVGIRKSDAALKKDLGHLIEVEASMKEETVKQQKRMDFLKKKHEKLINVLNRVHEIKAENESLMQEISEYTMELENITENESRLNDAIREEMGELRYEAKKLKLQRERCSELVFILKVAERIVRAGKFEFLEAAGILPDTVRDLHQRFLQILDVQEYEHLYKYDLNALDIFKKGIIRRYPVPKGIPTHVYEPVRRTTATKPELKEPEHTSSGAKIVDMTTAKILSELKLFKRYEAIHGRLKITKS